MTDEPDGRTRDALEDGARHSREAVTQVEHTPLRLVLWRRHKWKILGLLFLILTEACLLLLGQTIVRGPQ